MNPHPFADLPATPAEHFRLYFFAAVSHLLGQVEQSFGSHQAALEQFPFLEGYCEELAPCGLEDLAPAEAAAWWREALTAWESSAAGHLPLRALREAALLDHDALTLLMSIGLIEEDARFGLLFEAMQATPGQHRPTLSLLSAWWREPTSCGKVRTYFRQLQALGLVQAVNPEAPRLEWALQVPGLVWDVLRGDAHETLAPWGHYLAPTRLNPLGDLILSEATQQTLARLPALLNAGEVQTLVIRGPHQNARRTILGAVAHALGRGLLILTGLGKADDERWRLVGPLATLLHALPAVVLDLTVGETADLPCLSGYDGPLGVVLGRQGGLSGKGIERALTLALEIPGVDARRLLWQRFAGPISGLEQISERYRLTSGNLRRAAGLAQSHAALAGRTAVTAGDVQQASRVLNRQALDTVAARVVTSGDWSNLAVGEETQRELANLESRCRHRERLPASVGPTLGTQLGAGVRALFSGPSGTGKTLAARLLASVLQMDLYRLDLSAVVSKYIGETEKSLNQVFSRAEELDVILLLDEGDSLLTQRTGVHTSNDRYANLETNYLLQRLEAFEGILIVTTNASDLIDSAFQRRMDVLVEFRPPEAAERWTVWQLHLPSAHAVDSELLNEVAQRCALTGGQIRNAVLHASLLALQDGGVVTSGYLEAAVRREYRKAGIVCPLRRFTTASWERG